MKKTPIFLLISTSLLFSCSSSSSSEEKENDSIWNEEASLVKASKIISSISWNDVKSFSFVDRSYGASYYYDSKYVISGDPKVLVNYKADHNFKMFQDDFVSDEVSIDALSGVEAIAIQDSFQANEQIYLKDSYIYDIFLVDVEGESFANCYPSHKYRTLAKYLNYDTVLNDTAASFANLTTLFPKDSGFLDPDVFMEKENGKEHYVVEISYPGDATYIAYTLGYEVILDTDAKKLESISTSVRYYNSGIDGAYETSTARFTSYTIKNIAYGEKDKYDGAIHSIDELPDDKVHNAPAKQVDLSNVPNGELTSERALEFVNNILYYARDTRQTNYSFIYHKAYDFSSSTQDDIGDILFQGKLIAYQDNILDNHGTMRKVNSKDEPYGEEVPYWIYSQAMDDYVIKGGKFDKWITSNCAVYLADQIIDLRCFLDANPLFYGETEKGESATSEFKKDLSLFSSFNLGENKTGDYTINLSCTGKKDNDKIIIDAVSNISSNSYTANARNTWQFVIENDYLSSFNLKSEATSSYGSYYADTYEAIFLHAPKQVYTGDKFNFEEILYQVYWSDYNVL